jgi:hypothetical protein
MAQEALQDGTAENNVAEAKQEATTQTEQEKEE